MIFFLAIPVRETQTKRKYEVLGQILQFFRLLFDY